MKRVSQAEWLQAALKLLETEGVKAIRVERIARQLGISKSGFYWHFADRNDLQSQIIEYWTHEYTKVVTDNPILRELDPKNRLEQAAEMILEHNLGRYEASMLSWAASDPAIARRVRATHRLRLDFFRTAFNELGFEGDDLEIRARLFIFYQMLEPTMCQKQSKKSLHRLIRKRVDVLTRK